MINFVNRYIAEPNPEKLTILYSNLLAYAKDNNILPKIDISKVYTLPYELDNNDLRLAYMELKTFPSEKSVENMVLVIILLFKEFGLTLEEISLTTDKICAIIRT